MPKQNVLQSLLTQVGLTMSPLRSVKTPEQAVAFFRKMGYEIPQGAFGGALPTLSSQGNELIVAARQLSTAKNEGDVAAAMTNLFARLVQTVNAIGNLHAEIKTGGGGGVPNIGDLPTRLTDFLILEFLDQQKPETHETLHLLGLIEHEDTPAANQSMRSINWNRIGVLLNKPSDIAKDVYKWDIDPNLDTIFSRMEAVMRASSLPGGMYPQPDATRLLLGNTSPGLRELRYPIFQKGVTPATYSQFGITFSPIEASGGKKKGLSVLPYLMGTADFHFEVCDRGELNFDSNGDIKGIGLAIRPPFDIEGVKSMTAEFRASIQIQEKPSKAQEIIIIGSSGGTRLAIQGLGMRTFIAHTGGKLDIGFEGELKAFRLVINGGEGDGFLQKILSGLNVQAESALAFGMSLLCGFYFRGGAKLAMELPIHIELGPLKIKGLRFTLEPTNDYFNLDTGAMLGLSLGPLKAVVENIGLKAKLQFKQGNLGPANLDIGFKPPNRVGLSLDTGIVKGGGYLDFDIKKEEYAGILELSIAKIVTVKAIGLITTKMPDGSKGFSLLLIITAEFGTGIQLGFGFTLLGVGGLIGLNRTMLLEPLASGMRTGSINSIMFPPDPIANAPRIISDLRAIFPPAEGKFLIGPMVKLGWGTPTIISLAFGLIIEIPGNVAIVGVLKITLPTEEAPLMVINVAFLGALEFDKSRIWFFATMYDSRILFMTMEGDMGLLMDFSNNPNFVLSVGGFHPQFNPPPLPFPNPRRIHIDVLRNPLQRITVENYFAVTSNTVQFGARAELYYGISAFNIHGHFSFDALFQFSPFHFTIDISFSVGMDVFGLGVFSVNLRFSLSGPGPFRARGTATLETFIKDFSVDFDISWGEANNPKLPSVEAIKILVLEYNKADNWRAEIPKSSNLLVSLRKLDGVADKLVLHPLGTLRISQRTVPLGVKVDKVGNNPVSDAHLLSVGVNSTGLKAAPNAPQEKFPIAQFQNLSDADKLSRPSFQDIASGVELASSGKQLGSNKVVKRIVRYEVKILDGDRRVQFRWFKDIGTLFFHWLDGAAVTQSALSFARKQAMVPTLETERIKVGQPGYVVADVSNNKPIAGISTFLSETHARDYFNAQILQNPGMAEELHVIPTVEANF